MSLRGVRRFVEDLLRQRRPRPFRATPADEAEVRMAILLRAAEPGRGAPSEEFIRRLHRRLAAELTPAPRPRPGPPRRRFFQGASLAAASAIIGATVERVVSTPRPTAPPQAETLTPDAGAWQAVAVGADVPEGGVRRFDVGSVTGFVRRVDGQVLAVSGVCTHLGCHLDLDPAARRLVCPCHGATFTPAGDVLHHRSPAPLTPLPQISVRESGGLVEAFLPPQNT